MASVGFSSGVTAATSAGTASSGAASARDTGTGAPAAGSTQGTGASGPSAPPSTVVTVSSLQSAANAQDSNSPDGADSSQVKAQPPASSAGEAIGAQMVLVFDDQAHAMTVKMLDIETQKVPQDLPGEVDVASAMTGAATTAVAALASSASSGAPAPGSFVNTKA